VAAGNYVDIVSLLLERAEVVQALREEVEHHHLDRPHTPLPSTLQLAENMNMVLAVDNQDDEGSLESECVYSNDILKMLMEVVGDVPASLHLHACYAQGMVFTEWLREQPKHGTTTSSGTPDMTGLSAMAIAGDAGAVTDSLKSFEERSAEPAAA
jgi:hypothetical protein